MFTIAAQNGREVYGRKDYVCDTIADIELLPTDATPGSAALVINGGDLFILNCNHEWIKQGANASTGEDAATIQELQNQIVELTATVENLQKELGVI